MKKKMGFKDQIKLANSGEYKQMPISGEEFQDMVDQMIKNVHRSTVKDPRQGYSGKGFIRTLIQETVKGAGYTGPYTFRQMLRLRRLGLYEYDKETGLYKF